MIRLDLSAAPKWLDLGSGLRLQVLPVTTAIMVAARSEVKTTEGCCMTLASRKLLSSRFLCDKNYYVYT